MGTGAPLNVSTDTKFDHRDVLVRAGRRAWELYGEANSNSALDENVAVSLLAKHLVELANEGMTKEGPLAAAALRYLISLTTPPSPPSMFNNEDGANESMRESLKFYVDRASAKFLIQWRIPWG